MVINNCINICYNQVNKVSIVIDTINLIKQTQYTY